MFSQSLDDLKLRDPAALANERLDSTGLIIHQEDEKRQFFREQAPTFPLKSNRL